MARRILFITPPYHCGVVEVAGRWVPLTFVYLAGAVRKAGFEPIIYDAMTKRHSHEEIEKTIADIKPDFVATTAITSTVTDALMVLKTAKKINPRIITIIGGVHPTFLYEETLREGSADYVVRGEGEETLKELLLALGAKDMPENVKGIAYRQGHRFIATSDRPFVQDLDALDTAWDLIDWNDYRYFVLPGSRLGAVSTSRGCSHNCTFCSQQKFWHQSWRPRKPESVVSEIERLAKTYGVNVFLLPDEYPTKDRVRWERLLDLLIERDLGINLLMETRAEDIIRDKDILHKYKKAGIIHIYIGVESTDQSTLDLIKKDIRTDTGISAIKLIQDHGMITETSFILGFPHETKESIKTTLELSKLYNPDFAHFLALAPWPYADMYSELEPYIAVRDYRKYNLIDPVIKPEQMSLEDVDRAIIECYQKFYMGKLQEVISISDAFRRDYMLRSMRLMMNSSFIADKLGHIKGIPPQVEALIRGIGKAVAPEKDEGFVPYARGSVRINATIDNVFAFVSDPSNWPKYISGLKEIRNLKADEMRAGSAFDWTYTVRGISLSGTGKVEKFEKNRALTLQMHSLLPLRKNIIFEDAGDGTLLTVEVGFKTSGKILSYLFSLIKRSLNTMETTAVLERIKTLCEAEEGYLLRTSGRKYSL